MVRIITYPFPSVGLLPGVENLSTAKMDESWRVDEAARLSQLAQELLLRAHKPDAIIADVHFWWTTKIANELLIPRLTFCPIGIFPMIVMENLFKIQSDILSRKDEDPYQCYITVPSRSVVFICFGSWCKFSVERLQDIAIGLEESGKNFMWVVRDGNDISEKWMPEEYEERVKSRGLVVKGWVPQVEILRHESVGAFLTHCGWNSILEAVSAGVPMLTWPLVFGQFINERFVVDVKGYGARVWEGGKRSATENEKVVLPREVISQAVSQFMKPGGVGDTARAKIQEMMRMSNAATSVGGSSQKDLCHLIDDLLKAKKN